MLRYQHIQASGSPKTRLISLRPSPSVKQTGRTQPEGQYGYGRGSLESIMAFSARAIDGVIRRVKVGNRWGIVDRRWGLQGAVMEGMVNPDYESEDGPND